MNRKRLFWAMSFIVLSFNLLGSINYISRQELLENMENVSGKKQPKWYLINVLPRYVANDCSIKNSSKIPVHILEKNLKSCKKWPRDRKIIVYSMQNDQLSRYACDILEKLGFSDIHVLKGGLDNWKKEGLPLIGKCQLKCYHP